MNTPTTFNALAQEAKKQLFLQFTATHSNALTILSTLTCGIGNQELFNIIGGTNAQIQLYDIDFYKGVKLTSAECAELANLFSSLAILMKMNEE